MKPVEKKEPVTGELKTNNTNVEGAPDLTPIYDESEKKDAPTKIVVRIKANQKDKKEIS